MTGYDPIELSRKIERKVVKDNRRKYYRFRKARFYGGVATADCVGCNLSCVYCWSNKPRKNPGKVGKFYSPEEVSDKLLSIASKHDLPRTRVSGNEPTIGKEHLLSTLEKIDGSGLNFILETNGILIGADVGYAQEFTKFDNLHVRVSLKGCNAEQFSQLTRAKPEAFELQLAALHNLLDAGVDCHAAVIREFAPKGKLEDLKLRLKLIDRRLVRGLEFENLIYYDHVVERLKRSGFL